VSSKLQRAKAQRRGGETDRELEEKASFKLLLLPIHPTTHPNRKKNTKRNKKKKKRYSLVQGKGHYLPTYPTIHPFPLHLTSLLSFYTLTTQSSLLTL